MARCTVARPVPCAARGSLVLMRPACQSRVAFPAMPLARWKDLCLDATDMAVAAGFWAQVLGLAAEPPREHRDLPGR